MEKAEILKTLSALATELEGQQKSRAAKLLREVMREIEAIEKPQVMVIAPENLDSCTTREELKAWCKENHWKIPRTKNIDAAKQELRERIYRLEHHGDAFRFPA